MVIFLAGFGQESKSKKVHFNSNKNKSPDQLKIEGLNHHKGGNIELAKKSYESFIRRGVNDSDVLSNYALICHQTGDTKKALQLYEKCIDIFPNHSFSCCNLGYLYLTLGEVIKAEQATLKALEIDPKLANAHCNLGLIYKERDQIAEAIESFKLAIKLDYFLSDGYINLGLIYKSQNKLDEAIEITRKAIEIQPNCSIAFLNLGYFLKEKGNLKEAALETKKAIEINPLLTKANLNLSAIMKDLGDIETAITYAQRELHIKPNDRDANQLISELIKDLRPAELRIKYLKTIISNLMKRDDVCHNGLFPIIETLFCKGTMLNIVRTKGSILKTTEFQDLIKDELLINGLRLFTFNSILWEKAFTRIRKDILLRIEESNNKKNNKLKVFIFALAEQCFLNEYIFICSDEENRVLKKMIEQINIEALDELYLGIIACYIPIYKIIDNLKQEFIYHSKSKYFNSLLNQQLTEPKKENELKLKIEKHRLIEDRVSKKVRIQYEENPYPRWRHTNINNENRVSINSAVNSEINPNRIKLTSINNTNKVLIAGCGTGQQVFDALRYENSEITAIDISSSSIAYAKRKAIEYEINDVRFIQMDILELISLNETFDLIECSGVLHHMESPERGMNTLLKVLNRNGLVKLGLYSEIARKEIVKAREIIKSNNLSSDLNGMKEFRKKIFNNEIDNLQGLETWPDFYSSSMFRDLCFHSTEHRYSIIKIEDILSSFNLEFLGFILPKSVKLEYSKLYPHDSCQNNLSLWHSFEKLNQETFRSMYQFWARKLL